MTEGHAHRWRIAPNGEGACECGEARTFVATWDDVVDAARGPAKGAALRKTARVPMLDPAQDLLVIGDDAEG